MELLGNDFDRSAEGRVLRCDRRFALGLDLGKSGDPSALSAVEEVVTLYEGRDRFTAERLSSRVLHCRYLRRWPLGTPYHSVADDVCALERRAPLYSSWPLIADSTGVGRAVVEILRQRGLKCPLIEASVHGGKAVTGDGSSVGIPKRDLVASLVVALEDGSLKIAPALPEAAQLRRELVGFRQKLTGKGNDSFEAMSERTHDDLVNALALAVWYLRPAGLCGYTDRRPVLSF